MTGHAQVESPAGAIDRLRCSATMEVDDVVLRCVADAEPGEARCALHKPIDIAVLAAQTFAQSFAPRPDYDEEAAPWPPFGVGIRADNPRNGIPLRSEAHVILPPSRGAVVLYTALLCLTIGFLVGALS